MLVWSQRINGLRERRNFLWFHRNEMMMGKAMNCPFQHDSSHFHACERLNSFAFAHAYCTLSRSRLHTIFLPYCVSIGSYTRPHWNVLVRKGSKHTYARTYDWPYRSFDFVLAQTIHRTQTKKIQTSFEDSRKCLVPNVKIVIFRIRWTEKEAIVVSFVLFPPFSPPLAVHFLELLPDEISAFNLFLSLKNQWNAAQRIPFFHRKREKTHENPINIVAADKELTIDSVR